MFTKNTVVEKATISVSAQKVGVGPEIIMSAVGGGDKAIGSTCNLSTRAQSYIDETGQTTHPNFHGWFKDGILVSMDVYYSFTVTESTAFIAKWSWN